MEKGTLDKIDIVDGANTKVGQISLNAELFKKRVNKSLLYQSAKADAASHHHGTADTKTRAEVHRTGKKIYRQKGTGNARHGPRKSSPFVGGGRVFGPHPRDFATPLPKKMKLAAVREALKIRMIEGSVTVVKDLPFTEPKTKEAVHFFSGMGVDGALVVLSEKSVPVEKSIRNLVGFQVVKADQMTVSDLLGHPRVVFTQAAFEAAQKRYFA